MKYTTPTVPGHGRGKFLGFPTFNLFIPDNFNLKQGIWATHVWLPHQLPTPGSRLPALQGALHYGPVPVFNQEDLSLEIFLLDYDSDAPIPELTFAPKHYLRPVINFPTQEALVEQIGKDVRQVRRHLQPPATSTTTT